MASAECHKGMFFYSIFFGSKYANKFHIVRAGFHMDKLLLWLALKNTLCTGVAFPCWLEQQHMGKLVLTEWRLAEQQSIPDIEYIFISHMSLLSLKLRQWQSALSVTVTLHLVAHPPPGGSTSSCLHSHIKRKKWLGGAWLVAHTPNYLLSFS